MGGQENFLSSDGCSFLRISKSDEVFLRSSQFTPTGDEPVEELEAPKEMQLPMDDRLITQAVVFDSKLYCLAVKQKLNEVQKNVLVYDGKEWRVVY